MKNNLVALLLGGGSRVSVVQLLKRSAERLGIRLTVVSYELDKEVPLAVEGEVVVGLKWDDPNVENDIVRVAIEHEADMLIPLADGAISLAAACSAKLGHVFTPMTDVAMADTLYDRVLSAEAFRKAGIPSPRTYTVLNAEVPAIAKPRRGSTARTIKVFKDMESLMSLENLDNFFLQEFIEDFEEYSVDCYVDVNGKVLCCVPVKQLEVRGGMITRAVTCRQPELEHICHKIISAFSLRGPVTVQALYDRRRHRFVVTHVAPRLGDAVSCSIYAGAPICDYLIQECRGIPLNECDDWADDTLMATYTKEAVFFRQSR